MNLKKYNKYWRDVHPAIIEKMSQIELHMKDGLLKAGFLFGELYQSGCDEYRLNRLIEDANGNVKAILCATLYDSDFNEALPKSSIGINIELEGFNATSLARYCPYNYSENAFSKDASEIISRIEQLDALNFAKDALDEFNTDKLLNKEFAEHVSEASAD